MDDFVLSRQGERKIPLHRLTRRNADRGNLCLHAGKRHSQQRVARWDAGQPVFAHFIGGRRERRAPNDDTGVVEIISAGGVHDAALDASG